jgi:hypothetical protein
VSFVTSWVDVFFLSCSFFCFFFVICRGLVLDSEYRRCGACSSSRPVLFFPALLLVFFLLLSFTMSFSSGDNGSALDCVVWGPGLAEEFHAGWEGWLEGARLALLSSDKKNAARVAVLCMGRHGFLVVAEEGDFPLLEPWHCNGWVDDYLRCHYFGCLVYMDSFDKRF